MIEIILNHREMKLLSANSIVAERIIWLFVAFCNLMVDEREGSIDSKRFISEVFVFQSRRHMNYPFAFSFFWNGVFKDRLSICCEYRSINTMRVGGKGCLVAIIKVENAKPCRR